MLNIAELNIDCGKTAERNLKRLNAFKRFGFRADMKSYIHWEDHIPTPEGVELIVKDQWDWGGIAEEIQWHKSAEGYTMLFYSSGSIAGRMDLSEDYKISKILFNGRFSCSDYSIPEAFISQQFRNRILRQGGLVLHCSALEVGGQALLFSAASGTGKTTHTTLWEKHRNASVFNDDSPAIRLMKDGAYAYGTPWSGTSEKYKAAKFPIRGIVLLERGEVNQMERLSIGEAVAGIVPRVMLPYHDADGMKEALSVLDKIVHKVPIYRLSCTPDIRAVEAVEKALV